MTKQELMGKIDELRDLMSRPDTGLIDLRRNEARLVGEDHPTYLAVKQACDRVEKLIERMLFGVYHMMDDDERACSCGETYQSILPEQGWNAQGLAEDIEMPDGTWKVKLHNLDEPCEFTDA